MTVRKPIEREQKIDIDALIEKGAYTKNDKETKEISSDPDHRIINLRIPAWLLRQVDDKVRERIGLSRTGWILETIHKELREENRPSEKRPVE